MPSPKRERQREGRRVGAVAMQATRRKAARRRQLVRFGIIGALVAVLVGALAFRSASSDDDAVRTDTSTSAPTTAAVAAGTPPKAAPVPAGAAVTGDTPCPPADGSAARTTSFAKPPPVCIDPAKAYTAVFDTSRGTVRVALDPKTAPNAANNFVVLARYHYYDGSALHRTDPSIDIIQGGSPATQSASDPGPGYTIKDDGAPPREYKEGDLVMARSAAPDSAAAQFFFGAGPNVSNLNGDGTGGRGTYVTFGRVTEGLEVLKGVLALHQEDPTSGLGGAPREVVTANRITIEES